MRAGLTTWATLIGLNRFNKERENTKLRGWGGEWRGEWERIFEDLGEVNEIKTH